MKPISISPRTSGKVQQVMDEQFIQQTYLNQRHRTRKAQLLITMTLFSTKLKKQKPKKTFSKNHHSIINKG